jgi:hypothetical protein
MSKDLKTGTYFEEVMKNAKKNPGVGKYDPSNKCKIKGTYTFKEPMNGVMAEA